MIYFNSDYTEGAHPRIMQRLMQTNTLQTAGYGEDEYCANARTLIRSACGRQDIDVHFLVGGTQANLTVISCALRTHQGVISPQTGHIAVHETGAIEATGHKILAQPCSSDGKITAKQVEYLYLSHKNDVTFEHTVQPKMVYISQPTESGAVYTKKELEEISAVCRENGLYLFIDGARLGYALAAENADVTLSLLCELCDVFYIGGTKMGALFGEAVVIVNNALKPDFRYIMKQRGAMLAKGRLLGVQFETLFTDGLYMQIAERANRQAALIAGACEEAGFSLMCRSRTNQQFPLIPNKYVQKLGEKYGFAVWEKPDDTHTVIRFCTSWATTDENVESLIRDIQNLQKGR